MNKKETIAIKFLLAWAFFTGFIAFAINDYMYYTDYRGMLWLSLSSIIIEVAGGLIAVLFIIKYTIDFAEEAKNNWTQKDLIRELKTIRDTKYACYNKGKQMITELMDSLRRTKD
jgi:hypothetical protein